MAHIRGYDFKINLAQVGRVCFPAHVKHLTLSYPICDVSLVDQPHVIIDLTH